jgi:hypothetical protein
MNDHSYDFSPDQNILLRTLSRKMNAVVIYTTDRNTILY